MKVELLSGGFMNLFQMKRAINRTNVSIMERLLAGGEETSSLLSHRISVCQFNWFIFHLGQGLCEEHKDVIGPKELPRYSLLQCLVFCSHQPSLEATESIKSKFEIL
jgi:hypothetical protein